MLFTKKSWAQAATDCCRRNMHMLAFETIEEQTCLKNTIFNSFVKHNNQVKNNN